MFMCLLATILRYVSFFNTFKAVTVNEKKMLFYFISSTRDVFYKYEVTLVMNNLIAFC